ncbi:MAG: hypothetical protein AAGI01_17300, partial [Myxococcota bacterium]
YDAALDWFDTDKHRFAFDARETIALVGQGFGPRVEVRVNGRLISTVERPRLGMLTFRAPERTVGPLTIEVRNPASPLAPVASNAELELLYEPSFTFAQCDHIAQSGALVVKASEENVRVGLSNGREGPTFISTLTLPSEVKSLALDGALAAFMEQGTGDVRVYDLTDPYNPVLAHTVRNPSGAPLSGLMLVEEQLFALSSGAVWSTRARSGAWHQLAGPADVLDAAHDGAYLYVLEHPASGARVGVYKLAALDASTPFVSHPVSLGDPIELRASHQRVVARGTSALAAFDASTLVDPVAPSLTHLGTRAVADLRGAHMFGEVLAVATDDATSVSFFDVGPKPSSGEDLDTSSVGRVDFAWTYHSEFGEVDDDVLWVYQGYSRRKCIGIPLHIATPRSTVPAAELADANSAVSVQVTGDSSAWVSFSPTLSLADDVGSTPGSTTFFGEDLRFTPTAPLVAGSGYTVGLSGVPSIAHGGVDGGMVSLDLPFALAATPSFGAKPSISAVTPSVGPAGASATYCVAGSSLDLADRLDIGPSSFTSDTWVFSAADQTLCVDATLPTGTYSVTIASGSYAQTLAGALSVVEELSVDSVVTAHPSDPNTIGVSGGTL